MCVYGGGQGGGRGRNQVGSQVSECVCVCVYGGGQGGEGEEGTR